MAFLYFYPSLIWTFPSPYLQIFLWRSPCCLIFLFSCLCLPTEERIAHGQQKQKNLELTTEEGKRSQTFKVKHRKKWWKIKTRKQHFRSGRDYQNNDTEEWDHMHGIPILIQNLLYQKLIWIQKQVYLLLA